MFDNYTSNKNCNKYKTSIQIQFEHWNIIYIHTHSYKDFLIGNLNLFKARRNVKIVI